MWRKCGCGWRVDVRKWREGDGCGGRMVMMTRTTMMRPVEGAAALVGAGEVKRVGGKRANELVLVMIVILLIMMEMCSYHNNCEYHHECDD